MPEEFRQDRICSCGPLMAAVLVVIGLWNNPVWGADDPQARQQAVASSQQRLSIELRNSHLGYTYVNPGGIRYFVTQILLTNQSSGEITVPMSSVELLFDGVAYPPDIEHPKLLGYEFRIGGASYRFSNLPQTKDLLIPAGTPSSAWLVYTGLPKSPDIPDMELRFDFDGVKYTFDIDAHYHAQLALTLDRIGPRGALGLLTIDGTLNTINVGALVNVLDQLANAQVSRAVVCFGENATDVDDSLATWLRQRADGNPSGRNYSMFPAIVSTIREFHLAAMPTTASSGRSTKNDHESAAVAVEEALSTAYRGLPAEEIVEQIERGHRFAQASALADGGTELSTAYLPLLLDRAGSEDPLLRRAAFIALSGSGDSVAVDALVRSAQSHDQQAASLAVECLAASRYAAAHEALEALLDEPLEVPGADLVRILARHPRRAWSAYLARLARDDPSTTSPAVQQAAVLALGRIGHPDLTEILANALQVEGVRDAAFQLLLDRPDEASEQIAIEYALGRLDSGSPSAQMLQLFDRVRDPRVTPRLIVHLDNDNVDRSTLITTLARIGPATIDDELADRYESLKPNEQAVVLNNLTQLRSSRLLPLAEAAMSSESEAVFSSAARNLGLLADPQAVRILASQLQVEQTATRVTNLAKALENIGTQQAARALEAAKNSSQDELRNTIAKSLRSLRRKSPGGQHLNRAETYQRDGEYEKAIEHYTLAVQRDPELARAYSGRGDCRLYLEEYQLAVDDFTMALERDSELAGAYSGRGHCLLKLDESKQATADFRRAMQLDPDDGQAITGLGIALAISGDVEEAIQIIEEAGDRFAKNPYFAYNAACVYGRALERIPAVPGSPQQHKQRREFEQAAISLLGRSIDLGFDDLNWMKDDPDLASLHELEQFQQFLQPLSGSEETTEQNTDKSPEPRRTFADEEEEQAGEP